MRRTARLVASTLLLFSLLGWTLPSPISRPSGLFGISGIIPDPSHLDRLGLDTATSGFWIGASPDFLGGPKEELHTRQFQAFVERGVTPIATFYLGRIGEEAGVWAEAIVRHYSSGAGAEQVGAPVLYWELGDEQNGTWGTSCSPEEYARRVALLAPAVRRGCPECVIVSGGLLDGPEMGEWALAPYLEAFLRTGAGEWIDVYAFHYYGLARPHPATPGAQLYSSAETIVAEMRALLSRYGQETAPIWVTETSTFSGGMGPVLQSESDQAADLVKRYLLLWSLGVEVVQWCYLTEPQYEGTGEGFFDQSGLIYDGLGSYDRGAGVEKRAFYAYQEMVRRLGEAVLIDRASDGGVTWVRFESTAGPLSVLWKDPWLHPGPVWVLADGSAEVVGLCGEVLEEIKGWHRFDLELEPIYLYGRIVAVSGNAPTLQQP